MYIRGPISAEIHQFVVKIFKKSVRRISPLCFLLRCNANHHYYYCFPSALSTCLTLSRGTWRPSLWSRCWFTPPTTPGNLATSATQRRPPSGTMTLSPQTGTGSRLRRQPSRAESVLWRRTVSRETRRHLQPERHGTSCETGSDRGRHVYRRVERHLNYKLTHTHTHTQTHPDSRADLSRVYTAAWLMDTEQSKTRRLWDEGQHVFDQNFIYSPSVGRWRQVQPSKPPFARYFKGLLMSRFFFFFKSYCEDLCYLNKSAVFFRVLKK